MSKKNNAEDIKDWLKNGLKQSSPLTQTIVQNWAHWVGEHVTRVDPKTMAKNIGGQLNVPVEQWLDYAIKTAGPLLTKAGSTLTPDSHEDADDTDAKETEN